MKKLFWAVVAVALFMSCAPFLNPPNAKSQAADFSPLKKAKKNYYSFRALDISGDATNADASIVQFQSLLTTQTFFYRRTSIPKMSLGNIFNFRYYRKNSPVAGFEEENWTQNHSYFVNQEGIWSYYGLNTEYGGSTTYTSSGAGNYNYFQYLGALNKKKKKSDATKVYSFNVSGDETNADAVVEIQNIGGTGTFQYYRKYAIPEMQTANLPDYRLYRKSTFISGFDEESWGIGTTNYFVTDGYIWIPYGTRSGSGTYSSLSSISGDYRVYLYSTPKKAKKKLKRQYKKVYQFNASGDASNADKTGTTSFSGTNYIYYYRKLAVPEMKMADMPNVQFMKKNNFISGMTDESWSPNVPRITDGNVWASYGYTLHLSSGADTYSEQIHGDYRVFLYK